VADLFPQPTDRFQPGTRLRHHKGGAYEFVGFATHTEDEEQTFAIYTSANGRLWARPAEMFLSGVDGPDGPVARFEPLS
jgi:hypothetical protein